MSCIAIQLDFTLDFSMRTFLQPRENKCSSYYSPDTGRFLQSDPDSGKIERPQTHLNKYSYASGNPVLNKDPLGKFFLAFLAAIMNTISFVAQNDLPVV